MPAFVLIHGGTTSSRYFDRLRPLLAHASVAPDLPGRGARPADLMTLTVEDCVEAALADVKAAGPLEDPLVVFAHSSGGLVVPGLLRGLGERVGHLVYSSASIPPEGGTGLDCMKPRHAEGCRKAFEAARAAGREIHTLAGPEPTREQVRVQYGGDPLDDATVDYVLDPVRRVPDSFHVYFQTHTWQGVSRSLSRTCLLNLRDRAIPLALQREMIARVDAPVREIPIDGGHVPSVAMPEVVAALLNGIAAELVCAR